MAEHVNIERRRQAIYGWILLSPAAILLTTFAFMAGIQFLSIGMLGEVSIRTYYESQDKQPYHIRRLVNFDEPVAPTVVPSTRAA